MQTSAANVSPAAVLQPCYRRLLSCTSFQTDAALHSLYVQLWEYEYENEYVYKYENEYENEYKNEYENEYDNEYKNEYEYVEKDANFNPATDVSSLAVPSMQRCTGSPPRHREA